MRIKHVLIKRYKNKKIIKKIVRKRVNRDIVAIQDLCHSKAIINLDLCHSINEFLITY